MTKDYQIAEINIARMKGVNIDDPIMKEFVANLDRVNNLAETSEGFVWRLKDDKCCSQLEKKLNHLQLE